MNHRFERLESHLITLARSVAHLSSELRSQHTLHEQLAGLRKDVYELTVRRANEFQYLQEKVKQLEADRVSLKRIRKLKK